MKKLLSIFLAVIMAFSAVSFTVSAAFEIAPGTGEKVPEAGTEEIAPETPEEPSEKPSEEPKECVHVWPDEWFAKQGTCTEPGIQYRNCTLCNEMEYELIGAKGHSYGDETVVAPTCSGEGYTTKTCKVCGFELIDNKVDALAHTYGDFTEKLAPTCTEAGSKERTCSVCNYVDKVVIDALGHDYKEVVIAPNYEEGGYTINKCSRCDSSFKKPGSETDKLTGRVLSLDLGDSITMKYEETQAINVMDYLEIGGEVKIKSISYEVTHRLNEQSVVEATKEENSTFITLTAKGMGNATLKVTVEDEYGNKVEDEVTVQVSFSILDWFKLIGSILMAAIQIVIGGLDFSSLGQLFG